MRDPNRPWLSRKYKFPPKRSSKGRCWSRRADRCDEPASREWRKAIQVINLTGARQDLLQTIRKVTIADPEESFIAAPSEIEFKSPAMLLRFALIDAPSPLGVGPTGVEHLAEALRAAGLKEALKAEDGGAVRVPLHDPFRDPGTLLLNPSSIRDFSQRLADLLGEVPSQSFSGETAIS
jgi:hypothetical protein